MSIKVQPYDTYYTGLMSNQSKKALVLGKKTTTTGMLWWKETTEEDVWCIVGASSVRYCDVTCAADYFWGVIRYFSYGNKDLAEQFYKEVTEEA